MKFVFALSLASIALVSVSFAQPSYEFHAFAVPGSVWSIARDINSKGVVAGYAEFPDGHWSAGTWTKGKWTALSTPGATDSFGNGINDVNDVVGTATIGGEMHAALWHRGQFIDLGASQLGPGTSPSVRGVNNAGEVVGYDHDADYLVFESWIWKNGVKQNLPGPFGTIAAYKINNRGLIEGGAFYGGFSEAHPTLWLGGQQIDLGDPFGGGYSYSDTMNDQGQIAGQGVDPDGNWRGFIWDKGVFTTLFSLLDSLGAEVIGMNDNGDAVGDCFDYFVDFSIPTLWHNGQPIALGVQGSALAINNQGTIVGYTPDGACYWTPTSHG